MYSIASSTVVALLLLCCAAVPAIIMFVPPGVELPELPSLPQDPLNPLLVDAGGGRREAISWRAVFMRFLRPCSAILCEVRFEVKLVESASG